MKLYKAKTIALHSVGKDHITLYRKLHKYENIIMRSNPGSIAVIESNMCPLTRTLYFKRIFIFFEAQRVEFLVGCRPLG